MKNTHLEHLEDDILNNGMEGGKSAISFLRDLGKMLSQPQSNLRITTKWDGAPAIICGINPENGQFFVGTKSVFAKTNPKVMYSNDQIDATYSGELAKKLKTCLEYLPQLNIRGVVQGDLLFTDDVDYKTVNGTESLIFKPNTITYTVPLVSELAAKISFAKMGIVFHTTYSGNTLADMTATFGAKVSGTSDVFVASAEFSDASGVANFTRNEMYQYNSLVNRAEGSLKQSSKFLNVLKDTGTSKFIMATLFKQFFNRYIREGRKLGSVRSVALDFAAFYSALMDKEILTKKTERSKNVYRKMKQDGLMFIATNQKSIYFTIASYMNLQTAKNFVIRKLEKVGDFGTFLETENGYKVTAPEGFVAIKSGRALKLVDRLEFSRANFNVPKTWDTV